MSLDKYVRKAEFEINSEGFLTCKELAKATKKFGEYETKKLFASHIGSMLETAVDKHKKNSEDFKKIKEIRDSYASGYKIWIENLEFYDPDRSNKKDNTFIFNPSINNAANTAFLSKAPLSLATIIRAPKLISHMNKAAFPLSFSLKFLNKTYKEIRKPDKDYKRIAKYGVAGVGGALVFLPTTLGRGAFYLGVYIPLTAFFDILLASYGIKVLKSSERIEEPLPPLTTIKNDLENQIRKYSTIKQKYSNKKLRKISEDAIVNEIKRVNKYLKHHLKKIKLRDIDIDIDAVANKSISSVIRANMLTQTAELTIKELKDATEPLFAQIYAREIFHLDNALNEGRANLRTDQLLEDMSIYNPDSGYDLQLEKNRLISIAHAYTHTKKKAIEQKIEQKFVKEEELQMEVQRNLGQELQNLGLDHKLIQNIFKHTFPTNKKKVLLKIQSMLGGNNPSGGYTLDYYKLMKREGIV